MIILGSDRGSVDGGTRDYAAFKRAGGSFAIVRGSYERWADRDARADLEAIVAAGLVPGAYLFPLPGKAHPSPQEQVRIFAEALPTMGPGWLTPILDVEFPNGIAGTGLTRREVITWILKCGASMELTFGVDEMWYSSERVMDGGDADALDADRLFTTAESQAVAHLPLWLARYPVGARRPPLSADFMEHLPPPPSPKAWGPNGCWLHQIQGDALGELGFSSTVDLNRWFALGFGSQGSRVRWVQDRLGYAEDNGGVFDAVTRDLTRDFQTATPGLLPDAVVGPMTFSHLAWQRPRLELVKIA